MKTNHSGRTKWLLASLCLLVLFLAACSGADQLMSTILVVLGSVNVVLATINAAIPTSVVAAIEMADTMAQAAVNALKTAYDNYVKDKTGTGVVAAIQAAIAAIQQTLTQLEAAAHIDNASLQAWIAKVVGLIQAVVQEVVTDIVPNVAGALKAHFDGDDAPAITLNEKAKAMAAKLRADVDASLDSSGLPSKAVAAAHKHIAHGLAHHIGPIRV